MDSSRPVAVGRHRLSVSALRIITLVALALGRSAGASAQPSVTINEGGSQADPAATSPILFDVLFSEAVTGFTAGDVDLSLSTAPGALSAAVSGSGASYTVQVSGMTGGGVIVATVPAGVAQNAGGFFNTASTSFDNSVAFAPTLPSVSINQGALQADPTSASPIVFDVLFSTVVTGFDSSDVDLSASSAGGVLVAQVTGSGASYTVEVSGMASSGSVVAGIPAGVAQDAGGIGNSASSSLDNTVQYEAASVVAVPVLDPLALAVLAVILATAGIVLVRRGGV
jgi:hypothetical protein